MRYIYAIILCMTLSACLTPPGPDPTPTAGSPFAISQEDTPYAPKPEDLGRQHAGVIITSINLSERSDLSPVRVDLNMLGSIPSACHELRVKVNPPNETYQVFIEIYSVVDPGSNCEDVFQQFEGNLTLGVYTPGRYTIWVNEEYVGDMISY